MLIKYESLHPVKGIFEAPCRENKNNLDGMSTFSDVCFHFCKYQAKKKIGSKHKLDSIILGVESFCLL